MRCATEIGSLRLPAGAAQRRQSIGAADPRSLASARKLDVGRGASLRCWRAGRQRCGATSLRGGREFCGLLGPSAALCRPCRPDIGGAPLGWQLACRALANAPRSTNVAHALHCASWEHALRRPWQRLGVHREAAPPNEPGSAYSTA
eukprot:EG_transcript_31339